MRWGGEEKESVVSFPGHVVKFEKTLFSPLLEPGNEAKESSSFSLISIVHINN